MATRQKKSDFEKDLEKLKEITKKMESGITNIDESLKIYEEGTGLYRKLNKALSEMERKVEILMEDGSLSEFDETEN